MTPEEIAKLIVSDERIRKTSAFQCLEVSYSVYTGGIPKSVILDFENVLADVIREILNKKL